MMLNRKIETLYNLCLALKKNDNGVSYPSVIYREIKSSYYFIIELLNELVKLNIIKMTKIGRIKFIDILDKEFIDCVIEIGDKLTK